ncbi:hypothetical protein KUCAC02_015781 [Chaenocephalus aceratus]|uniref:Uncharacterized protein n=1 Tax=Chaenocephalus aceratus TaxID=36190 RepID=A0ACB9Y0C1_CHAAC|nr:hypothetical protein KUCAC02_015781 [Chaenocephalus aceratus]
MGRVKKGNGAQRKDLRATAVDEVDEQLSDEDIGINEAETEEQNLQRGAQDDNKNTGTKTLGRSGQSDHKGQNNSRYKDGSIDGFKQTEATVDRRVVQESPEKLPVVRFLRASPPKSQQQDDEKGVLNI